MIFNCLSNKQKSELGTDLADTRLSASYKELIRIKMEPNKRRRVDEKLYIAIHKPTGFVSSAKSQHDNVRFRVVAPRFTTVSVRFRKREFSIVRVTLT